MRWSNIRLNKNFFSIKNILIASAVSLTIVLITYAAHTINVSLNPPGVDDPFVDNILNARFLQTLDPKIEAIIENNKFKREVDYSLLVAVPIALCGVVCLYSDYIFLEPFFEKINNL